MLSHDSISVQQLSDLVDFRLFWYTEPLSLDHLYPNNVSS